MSSYLCNTTLGQVGKSGYPTTFKAGTTVSFNAKGLATADGKGPDETPNVTPINAVNAAKNCNWHSMDYHHRAFAGQPSRLFPLRSSPFRPGSYFVYVGPAGKDGLQLPPRKIKAFGAKELKGGHNYAAVMADNGETLRWGDNNAELLQYDKPPKNEAVVLARNEADPAEWYAICLAPAGGAAPIVPGDPATALHVTVSPVQHTMKTGEDVTTSAKVSGGVPPYTYQWFNNDKLSKVTKKSVRWTLRQGGTHVLKVIVRDSQGKTVQAQSTVVVHAVTAPPTKPPVPPTKPPVQGSGWYLEGAPNIKKSPFKKEDCSYFGYKLTISDGSANGSESWKDCSSSQAKCGGTYTGSVTWTKPPAYLKPGDKITFNVTAQTSAHNTCGSRGIGSWVTLKGMDFIVDAGNTKPKGETTWTIRRGNPGTKMDIVVIVQAAGLDGKVTYNYVYK